MKLTEHKMDYLNPTDLYHQWEEQALGGTQDLLISERDGAKMFANWLDIHGYKIVKGD